MLNNPSEKDPSLTGSNNHGKESHELEGQTVSIRYGDFLRLIEDKLGYRNLTAEDIQDADFILRSFTSANLDGDAFAELYERTGEAKRKIARKGLSVWQVIHLDRGSINDKQIETLKSKLDEIKKDYGRLEIGVAITEKEVVPSYNRRDSESKRNEIMAVLGNPRYNQERDTFVEFRPVPKPKGMIG